MLNESLDFRGALRGPLQHLRTMVVPEKLYLLLWFKQGLQDFISVFEVRAVVSPDKKPLLLSNMLLYGLYVFVLVFRD